MCCEPRCVDAFGKPKVNGDSDSDNTCDYGILTRWPIQSFIPGVGRHARYMLALSYLSASLKWLKLGMTKPKNHAGNHDKRATGQHSKWNPFETCFPPVSVSAASSPRLRPSQLLRGKLFIILGVDFDAVSTAAATSAEGSC